MIRQVGKRTSSYCETLEYWIYEFDRYRNEAGKTQEAPP